MQFSGLCVVCLFKEANHPAFSLNAVSLLLYLCVFFFSILIVEWFLLESAFQSFINSRLCHLKAYDALCRSTIRDKIIPHAVSWFTGEAAQGDEFGDMEDDEDEDIDEDDDEDEDEEEDDEEDDDEDEEDSKAVKKV